MKPTGAEARAQAEGRPSDPELADLSEEFFQAMHSSDPFSATMLGVSGFDALVPDPSVRGAEAGSLRFAAIEGRLAAIDPAGMSVGDRVNHEVLAALTWGARTDLEHSLWEANASPAGYVSPQGLVFQSVPAAPLPDAAAVDGYLERLRALPAYFDAFGERYREATARGRRSTRVGVLQAIEQLDGHLAQPLDADVLVRTRLPATVDGTRLRAKIAELVDSGVRPAERRLRETLEQELLPRARSDDEVGICFVPGGEEGYRDAVRRHTTTRLTAAEIHQRGRDRIAGLEDEWSELGARVLGVTDGSEVRRRLREDPNLRFHDAAEIVGMVGGALERAEGSRNRWFPSYRLPQCVIEEISPLEAGNAPLAYYRPPSADGSRPAAHCVLTSSPEERFVYEYEALAFHESSPGHHLQIAVAQGLTELPRYRRHLDAEACAFIEGWGLYSERLSDEMGLYSSDLQRLGMLSFDSLRAARLVVDTGMHHFGWSRQRAIDYLWENTATPRSNVENEIHRYISWPGQALAYMVGCGEIRRLRELGEQQLGSRFDIRGFHGAVLGSGAVPLGVLEGIVQRWIETLKVTG